MSTYSLRPATEDDLPKVLEIEQKLHVAPWTAEHFRAEMTKPFSQFLVLTDDETDEVVAGYIVYWVMMDECQILNIVVDLPFRSQGFAKRMLRQAVGVAVNQGAKRVVLDVRKSNTPAIQLYQSCHFSIVQVRKAAYSNGEDAYQMALNLNESTDYIDF